MLAPAVALLLFVPGVAAAQQAEDLLGLQVAGIRVTVAGVEDRDPQLADLVETKPGRALLMADVRATIGHLMALGRFEDVHVRGVRVGEGVELHYDCSPRRTVAEVVFRGDLGLSRRLLSRTVRERFGQSPHPERAAEVASAVEALYRERGYTQVEVGTAVEPIRSPSRVRMAVTVRPGVRARYDSIVFEGEVPGGARELFRRLRVAPGRPFDRAALLRRIDDYVSGLRRDGYYEARLDAVPSVSPDGARVDLRLVGGRGPRVSVAVTGISLSGRRLEELVPVEREGSVDEDLLEDSGRNIVEYLRSEGHRDARVEHRRESAGGYLRIVFDVEPGPIHRIRSIEIVSHSTGSRIAAAPGAGLLPGDVFVQSKLDGFIAALRQQYRQQGHQSVAVSPSVTVGARPSPQGEVPVDVTLTVLEGQRSVIGTVVIEGNEAIDERVLREAIGSRTGEPFYEPQVRRDAEAMTILYLQRGYQTVSVEPETSVGEGGPSGRVNLRFRVREGPQMVVDRVLVTGYERTSLATIRREIPLTTGSPIGIDALAETQRRVSALGLFRRVQVSALTGRGPARDVLVSVEEAPSTTVGAGVGVEGGRRLRGEVDSGGRAVESLDLAPRASFEVSRRNLWGKNRSVSLFMRGVLRSGDGSVVGGGSGDGLGLREYRVLGTFREPRALGSMSDLVVTGLFEQAVRSAFNFNRRGARAELVHRLSPILSVSGRYSVEKTRLFNERIREEDRLDIDRLFPRVRISAFSGSLQRDTRDDPLNPRSGSLFLVDSVVAARRPLGSEVGFVKSYVQGFWFRRLPGARETVFAAGARLGLATGFAQVREVIEPDGAVRLVELRELPASERFFAGGDTSVRGFALDRLGTDATLDSRGVPKGGNAVVIVNAELRVPFTRSIGGVTFLDAGNVFARASDFDPGELRGGAGFGLRYQSPIGPVRFDLGFKLSRRTFADGSRESPMQWYIGIGHAF